jgi:hypothetical protein
VTRRLDLLQAVKVGRGLQQIAEELALALTDPETPPAAKAACARELRMVLAAIAAQGGKAEVDLVDELAAKRKARRSS